MSLPGMKSTADFATDERPKNYREGLMLLEPRSGASLYRLTAAMRSEATDDPEFIWWNETLEMFVFTINEASGYNTSATAMTIDGLGLKLKVGDIVRNKRTNEVMRVTSVTSDTVVNFSRGFGGSSAVALLDNDVLLYVGSAYREGAGRAVGTSTNPTKAYNYTQIFRDPVEWTRTAMKTRYRTGDAVKHDKRRTMHKHSLGIERAFFLGQRFEGTESGQPIRTTGGLLNFIPAGNKKTVQGAGGALDMDEFESYFEDMFAYGSGEKLAYCSLSVIMSIQTMIRKNTNYQFLMGQKEYGLNVTKLVSPAGILNLTEHPAFGQKGAFLEDSMIVLDTANLVYRYITDTTYLKDREDRGTDGKTDEWLTECGLEVHNPETFFMLSGILSGKADVQPPVQLLPAEEEE